MSSSLLGTFQTDWITGRSLETVFFSSSLFLRIAEGAFAESVPWKKRREWEGMEETRQSLNISTLTQSRSAAVKVILVSRAHRSELVRWKKKAVALLYVSSLRTPPTTGRRDRRNSSTEIIRNEEENFSGIERLTAAAVSHFSMLSLPALFAYLRGK